jgi:hypothetical protein
MDKIDDAPELTEEVDKALGEAIAAFMETAAPSEK